MQKTKAMLLVVLSMFVSVVFIDFAQAQVARTFVSTSGADNSTCSVSSPCRTINAAISVTNSGGEVYCLTSGGYGSVTITKPIAIVCDRVDAALSGSSGAVVTVNAPGGRVFLQGLHITGLGTATAGISAVAADGVFIEQCVIANVQGSGGAGIKLSGTTGTAAVHNSIVISNANGIIVDGSSASGPVGVTVEDTVVNRNTGPALTIVGGPYGAGVSVSRSQFGANGTAISASGSSTTSAALTNSLIVANFGGFATSGGAAIYSSGNNQILNNGTGSNSTNYTNIGTQ